MLHQQIVQNKRKTLGVVLAYLCLFILVGIAIGYSLLNSALAGAVVALIGGLVYVFIMISQSTDVVMRLNHATEITDKNQYPMLWNIVEDMSMVARVPMPKIYVIQDDSPNAFATGMAPEKAAVAATTGLLNRLNREELEGVMAHEFAHIKNYDVRLQTILIALGGVIAMMVQMFRFGGISNRSRKNEADNSEEDSLQIILMLISFLAVILAPIMSTIIQLALSRNREYLADATAVSFTRNPQGLINALKKIASSSAMTKADPQSAALYILDPFKKTEKDSLFSTHPATSNRIKRLESM